MRPTGNAADYAKILGDSSSMANQGLGSLFTNPINPLSVALLGQQLYKGYSGRKTAERQKNENLRLLTIDEMMKAGIDPFAIKDIGKVESTIDPVEQAELDLAQQEMDIIKPRGDVYENYAID